MEELISRSKKAYYELLRDGWIPGEDYVFISGTVDSVVCQTVEASLKEATEKAGKMKCADIRYGDYEPEKAANEVEDLVNSRFGFFRYRRYQ